MFQIAKSSVYFRMNIDFHVANLNVREGNETVSLHTGYQQQNIKGGENQIFVQYIE